MKLTLAITAVSPTEHRLTYRREDGSGEDVILNTKSFLYHDLLHFAVETEAPLSNSFFGLLAQGKSYADLSELAGETESDFSEEVGMTERVVGVFTGVLADDASPEVFLNAMRNLLDAYDKPMPVWLTAAFVQRVTERMRSLIGMWRSTPFGQTMTLVFQAPSPV